MLYHRHFCTERAPGSSCRRQDQFVQNIGLSSDLRKLIVGLDCSSEQGEIRLSRHQTGAGDLTARVLLEQSSQLSSILIEKTASLSLQSFNFQRDWWYRGVFMTT